MSPGGSRPRLFFAPGSMGNVFTHLGHLARHLGPDQPFYGLQEDVQSPTRIEALASHYLAQVRAVQPLGPYLLGGVCHGGLVAFEMAQQILAQGQPVAFLGLVEPAPLRSPDPRAYARLAATVGGQAPRRLARLARRLVSKPDAAEGEYLRQKMRLVADSLAAIRYRPRPYAGWLDLFQTAESHVRSLDRGSGWHALAPHTLRIHEIPGNHAMVSGANETPVDEDCMRALAQIIRTCLDEILQHA
jgi:thioesterase domain-containing protein